MTLHLHRAGGTDVLADGLAQLLSTPLDDPFEEEVVAVPAKGVERWLAQRLSHRLGAAGGDDGVCAGVRFLNPHSLTALVLGIERDDPWRPERLTWPVLRAIDESLDEEWAAMLATHLGHGASGEERGLRRGRRYAVARRLAGLFADYAAQRPAALGGWLAGGDDDGAGGRVEPDLAWQPRLWRRVVELVDAEPPQVRHARVVAALETGDLRDLHGLDLPGRLSLFGHTRIARAEMQVLAALGRHRDVHLWLPQASGAAWGRIAEAARLGPVPREEDTCARLVRHRLTAGLGRDARELQRTLTMADPVEQDLDGENADAPGGSLLEMLQSDIRADRPPNAQELAARVVPASDRSVQVHACHGTSRQIEVLRDVLADLLQRDPSLEPRDILVMCPDIDAFAPLVHAGFGLGEVTRRVRNADPSGSPAHEGAPPAGHPAHGLRVRLADRAPLQVNPLMTLAAGLVELAGSRLTAPQVLDLARSAPVRYRFGFDDDDLALLAEWVDKAAIRWGLDAEHRGRYRLPLTQNTWGAGLDRVLVGAALDGREHDHLGDVLGLDDLDSGDLELAGRFTELLDRLGAALRALQSAQGVADWVRALQTGVSALADVPPRDAWMSAALGSELARVAAAADEAAQAGGVAGDPLTLALADVRALLAEQGQGRATRSSFRTGMLTVCTMVPMRSVPHRVVCLIGLDDGVFPRTSVPDGDDMLARRPLSGERDARSEDRQLLLDALMSARETLVVTYSGADEHTGRERPPAVPLGEVIDAVHATASGPGVERVVTRHPLQPFDPRNLGASQLVGHGAPEAGTPSVPTLLPQDEPFSYDPVALAGGMAGTTEQHTRVCLAQRRLEPVAGPLAAEPGRHVDLDELLRFFDHPARSYLRTRLGLLLPEVPEPGAEGIPIELDGLARWTIGDRLLAAVLAGRAPADAITAERLRGELPPGRLGERALGQISRQVTGVCQAAWTVAGHGGWGSPLRRESLDVDVTLPDGRQLLGTVPGMVNAGAGEPGRAGRALQVTYSTLRAKQRLRSWIVSLALSAAGTGASSHVVGQFSAYRRKGFEELAHGPHDPNGAAQELGRLVALRDAGLREPLPLPPKTSLAWARAYLFGPGEEADAHRQADRDWTTTTGFSGTAIPGEQDDPAHVRVYDGAVPLATILGAVEPPDRWTPGVTTRLGQLSLRVWRPLLLGDAEAGVVKEVSRRS